MSVTESVTIAKRPAQAVGDEEAAELARRLGRDGVEPYEQDRGRQGGHEQISREHPPRPGELEEREAERGGRERHAAKSIRSIFSQTILVPPTRWTTHWATGAAGSQDQGGEDDQDEQGDEVQREHGDVGPSACP